MAEKDIRYQPLDPDEKIMKEATEKLKTDPTNAELWFEKGMQHN